MGYIYLITNKINGKRYVGQTQQMDIQSRWRSHRKMSPTCIGRYLLCAYRKHGIPNFKFQIICICFNEDCDRYEEEYIKKFNTLAPNGYNLQTGGRITKLSDETKQYMSKRQKEIVTDERRKAISERTKGRKLTDEQKQVLSVYAKNRWQNMTQEVRTEYIKKLRNDESRDKSKEISEKSREALQTRADANKKCVGQFQNNIMINTFESMSHAARETNTCITSIRHVCNNNPKYKTAGGFVWKFV